MSERNIKHREQIQALSVQSFQLPMLAIVNQLGKPFSKYTFILSQYVTSTVNFIKPRMVLLRCVGGHLSISYDPGPSNTAAVEAVLESAEVDLVRAALGTYLIAAGEYLLGVVIVVYRHLLRS